MNFFNKIIFMSLIFIMNTAVLADEPGSVSEGEPLQALRSVIDSYTAGNNGFYNKSIAPLKSLNLNKSGADRISEMNNKIATEINSVLNAFDSAAEDKKREAVSNIIKEIDSELQGVASAHIEFIDGKPSQAFARTILILEKIDNVGVDQVMNVLSSYKRAAKPNDFSYEYENAENLTEGEIKLTNGNEATWLKAAAPSGFEPGKDYVLKKCRQIFGWRCGTTLYHVDSINNSKPSSKYLFMANYELKTNPDHREFINDRRSVNQTAGGIALFVVRESTKWVIIYGVDAVISNDKVSFASLIQQEFQKDFNRLSQRLSTDLNLKEISVAAPKNKKLSLRDKIAKLLMKLKKK